MNFRATQPLNGRIIEVSFPTGVEQTVEPGGTLSGVPYYHVPSAIGTSSSYISFVGHWWSQLPALFPFFSTVRLNSCLATGEFMFFL